LPADGSQFPSPRFCVKVLPGLRVMAISLLTPLVTGGGVDSLVVTEHL
jgi:hypothetical protein